MLVLTRKEGDSITLILPDGEEVLITLERYEGYSTKVSVEAPDEVAIFRSELLA